MAQATAYIQLCILVKSHGLPVRHVEFEVISWLVSSNQNSNGIPFLSDLALKKTHLN